MLLGVSGQLKSILKHRILGVRKRVSCAESGLTSLNDLYFVGVFLHKELLFGVAMIAPALNFLVALIF